MHFCLFWVTEVRPPGGTFPTARRRMLFTLFWVFLDELPGGDEFPPGDAGLGFGFLSFWGVLTGF